MAAQVSILGWRSANLRGYLRDANVVLDPERYPIALLQMPNGTGKTTTMALIRAALNGTVDQDVSVRSLRGSDSEADGWFELDLLVDGERFTIRITFDFRTGSTFFYTDTASEGRERGHRLPRLLEQTLRRGATRLFVFDGELAARMIEEGADAADASIEALYGTEKLQDVVSQIEGLKTKRKNQVKDTTTASSREHVDKAEREADEAAIVLARLEAEKEKLDKELSRIEARTEEIRKRRQQLGLDDDRIKQEQLRISEERARALGDLASASDEAIVAFRSPLSVIQVFGERLKHLSETLETRNLPRSSKSFFRILADRDLCICGRKLEDKDRKHIRENADDHLGEEEVTVINEIRYQLSAAPSPDQRFPQVVARMREADQRVQTADQDQNRLDDEKRQAGEEEIEALRKEEADLARRQVVAGNALRLLTQRPDRFEDVDWKTNLEACKRINKERKRRFETASGTRQYVRAADLLIKAAADARRLAKTSLRERVTKRTNDNLERILANEQLRVERIDGRLHLVGENQLRKDSASEGQKLAVCYAFLTALLADAPFGLPFVVDSPAVSLDLTLRETVGELIPPLFDQLIVFVISSERAGFADSFKDRDDTAFCTIAVDRDSGAIGINRDKDAFFSFQRGENGQ